MRKEVSDNLARTGSGVIPITDCAHTGHIDYLNDGVTNQSIDDWNGCSKISSWLGYLWKQNYNMNKVVYATGNMNSNGGWFASGLNVQVRQNFNWVNVSGLSISPGYPYNNTAGPNSTYTFTFNNTWGDGIRIIGTPGGSDDYVSSAEMEVYYQSQGQQFTTILTGWSPVNGTWNIGASGYSRTGSGDNFTLANEMGNDFTYEADVAVKL